MKSKLDMSLLLKMSPALIGATQCLENGESIYGRDQFSHARKEDVFYSHTLNGVMRHLMLYFMGEKIDSESKLSHLDHAISRLMFLSTAEKLGLGVDDIKKNFKSSETAKFVEMMTWANQESKKRNTSATRKSAGKRARKIAHGVVRVRRRSRRVLKRTART